MSDGTKLSQLPSAQNLADTDLMYAVEDDTSSKATVGYLRDVFVGAETTAREAADTALGGRIDGKQDALTFDNAPTENSNNPVKSGGIYTALADKANTSDLATVATSGAYSDLTGTPTIPTVEANPSSTATDTLTKIEIDSTVYSISGGGEEITGEASGAIASFSDGADNKAVKSLVIGIEPVQSGSGDPSPSNVRPIVGKNAVNVLNLDLPNGNYTASDGQISFAWKDGDTEYDMPFNVMANEVVKDSSDNDVDVLTLESEYVLPFDTVYDAPEAIIASGEDIVAGDYYFKIANDSWGNNNGKYICFTLDATLTAGKQIRKKSGEYNAAIEDCTLGIYTDGTDTAGTTLSFTVVTTEPSTGTSLGQTDGAGVCNYWACVVLGYNRWKHSAIRQWLNADAAKNTWWTQQHKWDVMPSYATTKDGFLYGMPASVKARLKETKVYTSRNTVFNGGNTPLGDMDVTLDKVFLASLEQMYITPQVTGEGDEWEYYKELNGTETKYSQSGTYPDLIKYDIGAKTTARYRWLRSAYRGTANLAWRVNASGGVSSNVANYGYRVAPCLRIGVNKKDTVQLGDTYYGGELDVTTGELTVTDGYIASYNGETLPSTWISDRDVYAPNTSPTTGAEVVYKLSTPTEVTLTPTEVDSLLGNNNIWADSGDSDVVYVRDLNLAFNELWNKVNS